MKFRGDKKRYINFPYFLARAKWLNKLFIRTVLLSQSFGKKMKFRDGKKRHIKFPYFSARPIRLNKLFIRGVYIVIQLKNINVSYFGHNALSDITTTIPTGQSIGIIGPNGAGKSTLLKSMLGVIKKDSGEVYINDQPISGFKKKIAYVAQRSEIDLTFPITVFDTVLTGTYPSLKLFVFPGRKEKERSIGIVQINVNLYTCCMLAIIRVCVSTVNDGIKKCKMSK